MDFELDETPERKKVCKNCQADLTEQDLKNPTELCSYCIYESFGDYIQE